jgi:beta-glucosidase
LWEFGTFESVRDKGQQLAVLVTFNTGNRTGNGTIVLFTSNMFASLAPDRKRLRRFKKIELSPTESQIVRFELNVSDLSFVNQSNARIVEK